MSESFPYTFEIFRFKILNFLNVTIFFCQHIKNLCFFSDWYIAVVKHRHEDIPVLLGFRNIPHKFNKLLSDQKRKNLNETYTRNALMEQGDEHITRIQHQVSCIMSTHYVT